MAHPVIATSGSIKHLVDRYIAAWNQTDAEARRELIADIWQEDGVYLDPQKSAEGREALSAMIAGVQSRLPGASFRRTSDVDTHHDCVRFSWELVAADGEEIRGGVDFGVIAGGRWQSITGFFDFAPAS